MHVLRSRYLKRVTLIEGLALGRSNIYRLNMTISVANVIIVVLIATVIARVH
jgi:hypothetical protein